MQEASSNVFGFVHLWESGDVISHAVAILLAAM
jgi:biopolymer transport protein ExbB